jgi:hypothetical protein
LILVISNIANKAASALVNMFPAEAAFLVTASEFHQTVKAGISVNNFRSSTFIINNKPISPTQVTGIITTITAFLPQEFYYIEPADRDYVCAEMNAFFIYFLSQLQCKKLNPSSQRTLTGLSMHKIELLKKLSALKIPLWQAHFRNGDYIAGENASRFRLLKITKVGDVIFPSTVPEILIGYIQLIAAFFSLPYIQLYFVCTDEKEYFLADVITIPNINDDETRDAILNYFKQDVI